MAWHATRNHRTGEWHLQWASRTAYGLHYEGPRPESFATKREAEALKRELRARGEGPAPRKVASLSAALYGITYEEEQLCEGAFKAGDSLRAALAWRWFQQRGAKRRILSEVSGIPADVLAAYVQTGTIDQASRATLEALR